MTGGVLFHKLIIMKLSLPKNNLITVLTAVSIIASGSALYFYGEYRNLHQNPNQVSQDESKKLLASVGELIILPQDETPTIATVSDPEKVKNQPFFVNAKLGDKVLIYTNAKKAILYNPESNKIVEVAPINIGNSQPQVQKEQ